MQIIAHRVFPDTNPIEPLATDAALPLAGVELDIRVDDAGNPVVYHAPLFLLRRHRLAQDRPVNGRPCQARWGSAKAPRAPRRGAR
ncbi:MAG: hypothetical protein AAGI34_12815, partial [Pseudomonadota bacterium]